VEALSIRFGTAKSLHFLWDNGKARVKVKGSDPSNHIKIGEGKRITASSRIGHLSTLKPDLPTNRPKTIGAKSI